VETAVSIHAVSGTTITAVMATKYIIALSLGIFFAVLLIFVGICCYCKYKKRKALKKKKDLLGSLVV